MHKLATRHFKIRTHLLALRRFTTKPKDPNNDQKDILSSLFDSKETIKNFNEATENVIKLVNTTAVKAQEIVEKVDKKTVEEAGQKLVEFGKKEAKKTLRQWRLRAWIAFGVSTLVCILYALRPMLIEWFQQQEK